MGGITDSRFGAVFSLYIIYCICSTFAIDRKVKTHRICPDDTDHEVKCAGDSDAGFVNIYHTAATGPHDVLHYVTTTWGYPGILVAKTPLKSTFNLNLTKFLSHDATDMSGSLEFDPPAQYVYTLHFLQILEYNDVNDTADLSKIDEDEKFWRVHNLADSVVWGNSSANTSVEDNHIVFTIDNSNSQQNTTDNKFDFQGNGSISFTIDITGVEDRTEHLPHLQYTSNTSLFQFTIDDMITAFDNSRFAVELLLVTDDKPAASKMNISTYRSIDDEHTPGVFEVNDVTTRGPQQTSGAYLQWKPVGYKNPNKKVQSTTKAKHYPLASVRADLLTGYGSLAYAYFGNDLLSGVTKTGLNVSFGLSLDKFYVYTNYTTWVMTTGYGQAPVEGVSSLVLIVISVGFGIPVLLILFGGVGVCVHRGRKNRLAGPVTSEYSIIN